MRDTTLDSGYLGFLDCLGWDFLVVFLVVSVFFGVLLRLRPFVFVGFFCVFSFDEDKEVVLERTCRTGES